MHMSLRGVALFTFTMDVLYVVFMGSELQGLLFICVTKHLKLIVSNAVIQIVSTVLLL